MKHKHRLKGYIILGLVIIAFIALRYLAPGLKQFADPLYVRDLIISLGSLGYIVYILLLIASIPFPIPSTPIVIAGGYVFGTVLGTVLSLIAAVLGGTISFLLIRKFGLPLLEKLVDAHHIKHFQHILKKRGFIIAFISIAIPIFPSDSVALMLGLTSMGYLAFFFLFLIAHIPRFLIINSVGNNLFTGFSIETLFILAGAAVFILIAIFRERLKKLFFKELHELEKEAKVVERKVGIKKTKKR
jgi:uncharacterized membrane protein YdjX (TVP38/TMEM64 family)